MEKATRGKKVVVILGPNASGKSDIAIKLAKEFDGEVVSADSRQIYRGMDIGTGKVKGKVVKISKFTVLISEEVPHYMIDIVSPKTNYNVAKYKKKALKVIEYILSRNKLPIICGGTGFWIKAIVDNLSFPEVVPNWKLRKRLSLLSTEQLYRLLKREDPIRAGKIDRNNKVRLIRALEICEKLKKVPEHTEKNKGKKYEFLQIGINRPKEVLAKRIRKRLEERLKEGMVEEVKKLHKSGISWKRLDSFGLEYRWVSRYLKGEIDYEEMKEKLYYAIKHYAKRQMTWFKADKRILWLNNYKLISKTVKRFIERTI